MHKTKLRVQVLGLPICDKTYIAAGWNIGLNVFQYLTHNARPKALALMLFEDGNIYDLKKTAAITDDSPHSNWL